MRTNPATEENATRAEAAREAVRAYVTSGHGDPDDLRASIVDLVTDLLHLAEREFGRGGGQAVEDIAGRHFRAEMERSV